MTTTKRRRKTESISDQLRNAIEARGVTHYRLGKDAAVATGVIDRFVSRERDIRLETAARLAAVLGLSLK